MSENPSIHTHPSIDTWIDYHAGRVSDEQTEGLRRHLSGCRQCVDLVLDLDAFIESAPPPNGAAADFEKAAVWRTVKRGIFSSQGGNRRWPTVVAVAASMLFAVAGLSQRSARVALESQLAELTGLQANMAIVDLRPGARERSSGGVDATVDVPAGNVTLILHLQDEVDYPDYQLRVFDAQGTEVDRIPGLLISDVGNFSLGLAAGALTAGSYELQLFGLAEGVEEPLETYPIRVR